MDMRHRVVNVERPVLVARDEVHDKIVHRVGQILFILQRYFLPVEGVSLIASLRVPIFSAAFKPQIFVESPVTRLQRQLTPLATHRCDVAHRFEHLGHHGFFVRTQKRAAVVSGHARMKRITPRHQHRARRPAERTGVAVLKACAGLCKRVDVWRLVVVRTVATHVSDAEIVSEDEDDVRFLRSRLGGGQMQRANGESNCCKDE